MKHWITAALLAATASAQAATVWDEASQGDLSNARLDTTVIAVAAGHNVVLGLTGNAGSGVDRDYFRFTVPVGTVLTELVVLPNTGISGSVAFIGFQAGPQMTVAPNGTGMDAFYGFGHFEPADIGTNILPRLVSDAGKLPVPWGTYSFWVQETGGEVPYGLDFVLAPVPEPTTLMTLGLGLLGLACRRFVLPRR